MLWVALKVHFLLAAVPGLEDALVQFDQRADKKSIQKKYVSV
jgi:hypothetical protein